MLRGDDARAQAQIPRRSLLDLQQHGASLLLDLCDSGVTANRLDLVRRLAVEREEIARALIPVGEFCLQLGKFRLKRGTVGALQQRFGLLDRWGAQCVQDIPRGLRATCRSRLGLAFEVR